MAVSLSDPYDPVIRADDAGLCSRWPVAGPDSLLYNTALYPVIGPGAAQVIGFPRRLGFCCLLAGNRVGYG